MWANHALSGEIIYRKSRMTRSENYYPTLVKVREFIHYARKHPRQQREQHGHQHGHHQQQGHRQVVQHDHNPDVQASDAQQAGGHREQGELSVATNRYALPEDNVPGGPQV